MSDVEKVARAIPDEAELVDAIAIICMELDEDRSAENAAAMFRAYGSVAHDCPEHNNGTRVPYGCGRCDVEKYRSHARRILAVMECEGEAKPVARDPSRFSRLSQDERPVIRERPDPTLGFISTAEMLASPPKPPWASGRQTTPLTG